MELQAIIKKFVHAVRKKNGNKYKLSSIRCFAQGIDCYLKKINTYGFSRDSTKYEVI